MLAMPDVVYRELDNYGQYLATGNHWNYDEELELSLLEREDRLIDLALAKNAASDDVVGSLYSRSLAGTGDPGYDKAVRLACLANEPATYVWLFTNATGVDESELRRLALYGDSDELSVLMRNPRRRGLLPAVYERRGSFENIPEERWFCLVRSSVDNPGLNIDESDIHGPDFTAWDLGKAIVSLLRTAPTEQRWIYALYSLLLNLNPESARSLDSKAIFSELLARWKTARASKTLDENAEAEGYYSPRPLVEEFCGVIAALYGCVFEGNKLEYVGELDSEDVMLRCAYYGRNKMNTDQMRLAWDMDGNLFVLTALFNNQLLLKDDCRRQLEDCMPSDLQHFYARRCSQLQAKYKWFDPRAVTDEVKEELQEPTQPANAAMVGRLAAQVTSIRNQVAGLSKQLWWGALILAGLVLWHR
ncbi:hypothetical protein [Paraburkholderia bonniea]|uniref:hypothetical protein n=1 Tax=Paraburkholderia bonniea TaxID=2152891 RepID=UPI00129177FC|nr:hypothetical protein [Paraburkholderia bonniea]